MATVRNAKKRGKGLLFCKSKPIAFFPFALPVDVDVVFAYKHYVNVLQSSLGLQKHRKQPEKLPGKVSVFCLFIGIFYP